MAEVKATTKLDSTGFKRGTTQMKGSIQKLSSSLGSLKGVIAGAFSVGAIVNLTKQAIQFGSTISDLADQAGLSTDQFQALELAALDAGVSQDKIRTAMSKLSVVMGQAKSGMKTYVDLFEKVGISQEALVDMNPSQVFEKLAKTMSESERGTVEFGAALEILGTRSGAQLVEVMRKVNEEGLDGMIERGKKAGQIMGKDLVNDLDEAADAMARFQRATKVAAGRSLQFFEITGRTLGRGVRNLRAKLRGREGLGSIGASDIRAQLKTEAQEAKKAEERKIAEKKGIDARATKERETATQKEADKEEQAWFDSQVKKIAMLDKLKKKEIKAAEDIAKAKKKFLGISVGGRSVEADRLGKIGGSVGGAVSPELSLAKQNLELNKKRNEFLGGLAPTVVRAIESSGGLG